MYWISLCSASWAELSFQVRKMMQNCLSQYAYALSIFPYKNMNAKNYTLFYRASPAVWGSINVPGSGGSWGHRHTKTRINGSCIYLPIDFVTLPTAKVFFTCIRVFGAQFFYVQKSEKKTRFNLVCVPMDAAGPPFSLCQQRKKPNTICSWTKVWVITFVISNYGVWVETFLVGTKTLIFVPAALGCYLASIP